MARKKRESTDVSRTFSSVFNKYVKDAEKNGHTQQEIAKGIGITQSQLFQYMNDYTTPTIDTIYSICKYFDISADYMIGLSPVASRDVNHSKASRYFGLSDAPSYKIREMKNSARSDTFNKMLSVSSFYDILDFLTTACKLQNELPEDAKEHPEEYKAQQRAFTYLSIKAVSSGGSKGQLKLSHLDTIEHFIQLAADSSRKLYEYMLHMDEQANESK